jgi:hypothetical protein
MLRSMGALTSDVMFGLVAFGTALTVLYLVTELVSWRLFRASEIKTGMLMRELYKKLHGRTKLLARPFGSRPKPK